MKRRTIVIKIIVNHAFTIKKLLLHVVEAQSSKLFGYNYAYDWPNGNSRIHMVAPVYM